MTTTSRLLVARRLMQRMARRTRKGFTLIELLVVVVIIGILASVALPSFIGAQDRARNAGVQSNLATVRIGLEQFATDHNGSYPATSDYVLSIASGLLTSDYLPGNKLPRSPWCTNSQTAALGIPTSASAAANLASGSALPAIGTIITAVGTLTTTSPTTFSMFGAIEYDYEPNSQTYVLYGTGKKNKAATISAALSNNAN